MSRWENTRAFRGSYFPSRSCKSFLARRPSSCAGLSLTYERNIGQSDCPILSVIVIPREMLDIATCQQCPFEIYAF